MKSLKHISLLILFLGCVFITKAQQREVPKNTRILFVLDASGSMLADWEGKRRIDIAKEVLSNMIDTLATKPNVSMALRVYGHQYSKKFGNCQDTKLEAPFAPNNARHIKQKLYDITPQGVTPIAYSLLQSAYDFPESDKYRNVIIIITDGLESCDGDPCKISAALQKKKIFLSPFIIGIGLEKDLTKAYDCMGNFINASTVKDFKLVLNQVVERATTAETKVRVDLLDSKGKATVTNVNMTFANNLTAVPEYDFVHYQKDGKSDYVKVDPVLTYAIQVNTIPEILERNIYLEIGKENIIKIPVIQGSLKTQMGSANDYKNLRVLIKNPKNHEIIHEMGINETEDLLAGTYDIEVLTLPRTSFNGITIKEGETRTLDIDSPGILSIPLPNHGFGSLYQIHNNGREQLLLNFEENARSVSYAIQPGDYKVVFRAKNALGSEYTTIKRFTIKQGASSSIKLF